jgi:hypothetical protein
MNCLLCSGCYWLGHFWARYVVALVPDAWEAIGMAVAQPYFWLMRRSVELNDRGDCGVWGPEQDS